MGAIFVATGGRTGSDQWSTGRAANPHRGWGFRVAALLSAKWKIATGDVPQITKIFWHQKKDKQIQQFLQLHHQHNELSETMFWKIHGALHPGHGWPQCPIQALKTSSCSAIGKGAVDFFFTKLSCQLPALAWILVLVDVFFTNFWCRVWPSLTTSWLDPSTLVLSFSKWLV